MSTLWYRGSDKEFHYFAHFVKTTTNYRVPLSSLVIQSEDLFNISENRSVLVAPHAQNSIFDAFPPAEW